MPDGVNVYLYLCIDIADCHSKLKVSAVDYCIVFAVIGHFHIQLTSNLLLAKSTKAPHKNRETWLYAA